MARKAGLSRNQRREELLSAARQVVLPDHVDVCVVGSGAAGLAAAIAAAESGARVVVLERDLECGRTILATGNGRCNFANTGLDPALYNDPSFVRAVCGTSWLDGVLAFFAECGLAWEAEDEGRLYPLSRQAASVRNVLLLRAQRAGVILAPAREVEDVTRSGENVARGGEGVTHRGENVSHKDKGFSIRYRELFGGEKDGKRDARTEVPDHGRPRVLHARRVIVATGGGVSSTCTGLGLTSSTFQPVLCPLRCEGPLSCDAPLDSGVALLKKLDGRRVHAQVALLRDGHTVAAEYGEVLFREYGLSGIVVFNLSRYALPGDELVLDLLPRLSDDIVRVRTAYALDGLLDPQVAQALLEVAGDRERAISLAGHLTCRVIGPAEADRAQVSRGGLACAQFDPATLEARSVAGLHACGEALDVDGPCGGFNLAWAWKSGLVAGTAAASS